MSGFWIDVYDAAGAKENGTSIAVADVSINEKANRIGEVQFTLPALEAERIGAVFGKRYRLYSERNGYRGKFRHRTIEFDADGQTARITADDSLIDLANDLVGYDVTFTNTAISTIVSTIAGLSGWTVSYEPGVLAHFAETISLEFQGESVLTALDFVRNYKRGWFTRWSDTEIRFGMFRDLGYQLTYYNQSTRVATDGTVAVVPTRYGDATWQFKYQGNEAKVLDSEIDAYLTNLPVMSSDVQRSTQYVNSAGVIVGNAPAMSTITRLTKEVDGTNVVNRVVPRGAGQGVTHMDLRYAQATTNPFPIQYDATGHYYYIEDPQSVTLYGRVKRILPFSDVRPITNSPADLQSAGNVLYVLGLAYLRKFAHPFEVFSLQCVNLPEAAKVGSVVLVDFRGIAYTADGEEAWLHINERPFFIIEKTTSWGDSGEPVYDLVISSNGEGNISTADIFKVTLAEIDKFRARPEPTIAYFHESHPTLPVQALTAGDANTSPSPAINASCPFDLDAGVLLINNMTLKMKLTRFTSYGATEITPGAMTVGPPPEQEVTTEGGDLETSGASTKDTADNNTSQAYTGAIGNGGLSTPTSGVPVQASLYHTHTETGSQTTGISYGPGEIGDHKHNVNIPDHQHPFTLPAHGHGMKHTHDMDPHSHRHPHSHGITGDILDTKFGVFQAPNLPTNVAVYFDGDIVTGWTVLENEDSASTDGTNCTGAGLFTADITSRFPAPGQQIAKTYRIEVRCGQYGGLVSMRISGRITVQPIAA